MRLEGLGKLKKIHLIGARTRDLNTNKNNKKNIDVPHSTGVQIFSSAPYGVVIRPARSEAKCKWFLVSELGTRNNSLIYLHRIRRQIESREGE
jgi:hypothetical protein